MPGEASCLTLVWAVLDRASQGWRGLAYTPAITRALAELRHQLHHRPDLPKETTRRQDETITPAA